MALYLLGLKAQLIMAFEGHRHDSEGELGQNKAAREENCADVREGRSTNGRRGGPGCKQAEGKGKGAAGHV